MASVVEFYCGSCGREVDIETTNGRIYVEPCKHCLEESEEAGYCKGAKDAYDDKEK